MTGIIWACAATLLVAATIILAKIGTKKTDPVLSGSLSGLIFCVAVFITQQSEIKAVAYLSLGYRTWIFLLLTGVLTALFGMFFYRALKTAETSEVYAVVKCNYIITFIAGVFMYHNTMGINDYILIACMVGGTIIINYGSSGVGMAVLASVAASCASMLVSYAQISLPKAVICFISVLAGTVILFVVVLATGGVKKFRSMSFLDGVSIMLSGAMYPMAYIMYHKAYALAGIYASYIFSIAILVLMIISSVVLKEKISGRKILGALLFIAALFLKL